MGARVKSTHTIQALCGCNAEKISGEDKCDLANVGKNVPGNSPESEHVAEAKGELHGRGSTYESRESNRDRYA